MNIKNIFAAGMLFIGMNAFAEGQQQIPAPAEKEVVIGINGAYVPGGFDTASDVYVVVNGIFQNGCYKWKRADVNNNGFYHEIKSVASVSQGMCLMVLVPFQKEVRLGQFDAGKHTLRFVSGDGTYLEKTLVVE